MSTSDAGESEPEEEEEEEARRVRTGQRGRAAQGRLRPFSGSERVSLTRCQLCASPFASWTLLAGGADAEPAQRAALLGLRGTFSGWRAQQDEAFKRLQQENHHGDISAHEPDGRLSASTQEEPRRVPVSGADRLTPARARCADSGVQPQKRVASRFTSRLFRTPSNNLGVDKQEQILKKSSTSSHSFIEPLRVERGNSSCQVNRETPCEGISVESASTYRLSEASQTKEEVVCNELVAAKDLRTSPCFSNDSGSPECNGLHRRPFGKSPVDIKALGNKLDELSHSGIMLSSTVVTVLAPHWSGRRRSKRLEDSNTSEAQGNPLGVANSTHSFAQQYLQETRNQHPAYRVFTERSQDRLRVPFLGNRSNTVGWSSSSGPASLNYECKRKMIQTISLDVNPGRLGDEAAGSLSPINTAASPLPPLSRSSSEQRTSQTGHQGGPSTSSSKPTTSSLLLSLRRSSGHSSTTASSLPKPFCLSSSSSDRDGKLSTALYAQTFLSKSEQAKSKPLLSPPSTSCGPSEPGQVLSPLSSNHKERNISGNVLFSSIPTNKDAEDTLASKRPQTMSRPQSGLTCPKHSLSKSPSERQDANTSLFPAKPHSSYDRSATLKEPLFSGRTILTSKSWWKPDALEGRSLLRTSDATQLTDKHNTPTDQPCNDYSDVASPLPNDNKGFASSFSSRVNNNTTESVCRSNTNFATKTQGGLVAQRATEESPDHASDLLVKQPFGSSLNTREPQEPHGLPSALSCSKISSAAAQTALSHSNDLNKQDESNSCISESLPPTLLNPMSSASPTERSSAFHFNHRSPRSYSIPASPHRNEAERQTGSYAAASAVPTNTKSSSAFHSRPVLTKHSSVHAGSSFQAPSTTNPTPLGFERTYASIPKPVRHKTGSSLIPSVSGFSKTNPSPVSTASIASSPTATHPSLYLTAPPVPPAIKTSPSSLLTPPATPVSHSYSDSSSPKDETNPLSPEKGPKQLSVERKRVRRVTWEDSVDLQHSGPKSLEKPDSSHAPTDPLSPSRSPRSVSTPSIFSFLRSNSPNKTTSPLSSPAPKTSSIQVGNGRKLRSLSSDSADLKSRDRERSRHRPNDTMIFNQERRDSPAHRQERTRSVEADLVQCRTSAALSLPPDFSSDYKLRYSSPPYTSLMSSRSIQGETRARTLRPPLFQEASRPVYTPQPSTNTDPTEVKILPTSKAQISPTQSSSLTRQNGPVALVNNRVRIISHSLESDNGHDSTCVTETLVYSLKPKVGTSTPAPVNTSPAPVQPTTHAKASEEAEVSRRPHRAQRKEPAAKPHSLSDESSTGSSSTESQQLEGDGWGKKVKASVLGKSRFFSVESEQSAKKSRFALKKSISSPNPTLSRSDSDRTTKSNNKVDQVLNKLRQTFGNKRSDDDASFPWKWKRGSQTPSLSGSSDNTTGSTKTLEEQDHEGEAVDRGTEGTARWAQNKYTIVPLSSDRFSARVSDQDGQRALAECTSDSNPQVHVTVHSPAVHQFDYYNDSRTDSKPTTHFLFCRETPPGCYAAQSRKSTSSPRSPFSPFSSLSPLSPFSSPDTTDDSVFYSPKLQRRRESSSPCEPGEGMSLGASRRSRASTGPPGSGQGQGSRHFTSSYADLKYGIEPGRSFSVSSVLSSRASKPGRISTGSRFMSVGDLSESVLTGASTGRDMDQGSPSWTAGHDCKPAVNSYFPSDPGKARSRSLPRSLTLANWSSGISICHPAPATSSRPACLWSPSLNPCHFAWDAEGPPTPPPTPPLSPVSRRMSQPSSQPSPGSPQTADSQSSRGHLPSRGYVSSLSTFEESSDSSSDTTTDDEYYLETGEEEKETEL